jgi:hypothetical protein
MAGAMPTIMASAVAASAARARISPSGSRATRAPKSTPWTSVQPGFAELGVADALPAPAVGEVDAAVAAEQQGRVGEFGSAVGGRFDGPGRLPVPAVVGGYPELQRLAAVGAVAGQQQAAAFQTQRGERGVGQGHRQCLAVLPLAAPVVGACGLEAASVAQQGKGAPGIKGEHRRLPCRAGRQACLADNPAGRRQAQDFALPAEQVQADRQRQAAIGQRCGRRVDFAALVGERRGLQARRFRPALAAVGGQAVVDRAAQGPGDIPQVQPATFGVEHRLAEFAGVGEGACSGALPAGDGLWFAPAFAAEQTEADDVFAVAAGQPGCSQAAVGELGQRRMAGRSVFAGQHGRREFGRQGRRGGRWRREGDRRCRRNAPESRRQRQGEQQDRKGAGGECHGERF